MGIELRWLVDENLSSAVAEVLIAAGHDVKYQTMVQLGAPDQNVLATARMAGRVVVTQDKDFGTLVFHQRLSCEGVVLLRLAVEDHAGIARALAWHLDAVVRHQPGHFITIDEHGLRVRPLP